MKGSLLWWAFILAVCNAVVQVQNRDKNRDQMPWVTATMLMVGAFFLALLVFITDPFERLPFTPREGSDLNPLLRAFGGLLVGAAIRHDYVLGVVVDHTKLASYLGVVELCAQLLNAVAVCIDGVEQLPEIAGRHGRVVNVERPAA